MMSDDTEKLLAYYNLLWCCYTIMYLADKPSNMSPSRIQLNVMDNKHIIITTKQTWVHNAKDHGGFF